MKFISCDIGTKTLKAVISDEGKSHQYVLQEHYSNPAKEIAKLLERNANNDIRGLVTGKYLKILSDDKRFIPIDWTIPVIGYLNKQSNGVSFIIDIGATSLSLLEIRDGKFHRFQTNSLCASGTGSFLDQQMLRMDLSFSDIEQIKPTNRIPVIASRCAVFAKSDLIHRQQEGYTIDELWNGLVKGMAESCYATLLRGTSLHGKIMIIGGLIRNPLFFHYFSQLLDNNDLVIPDKPESFIAHSGIKYLQANNISTSSFEGLSAGNNIAYEKKLVFSSHTANKLSVNRSYDEFGNEINIDKQIKNAKIPVYFGVDIGSTSTKGILINSETKEILFNIYRKTAGNPISAYQKLLKGINIYQAAHNVKFVVKGMGTTGSGRRIVGAFAGADLILNEITAHLKGAIREFPTVRTIFEIGGQDSKYILVHDKWMRDANMNYACAAGTGSFLEEQAQMLNIKLEDFEKLSSGVAAPKLNDRCTVFMEIDAQKLIVDSVSISEVVTSLLHAVCRNYLHRVVQNRPIEEPIIFLGATARNRGLVEAFSNILGKRIETSKYSHIMGALGLTELLSEQAVIEKSSFKGWDLDEQVIEFREKHCDKCQNRCRIMYFDSAGTTVSWGYMCGKENNDEITEDSYDLFFKQSLSNNQTVYNAIPSEQVIYLPKALFYYSHGKFWQSFWNELGFKVIVTPDTDRDIIDISLKQSPNELCYPMKLAIGHAIYLIKTKQTPIFLPYIIRDTPNPKTINSFFCVITQSLPAIVKNILSSNNLPNDKLFSPVIDFSEDSDSNIDRLTEYFSDIYSISRQDIKRAYLIAQDSYSEQLTKLLRNSEKITKILSQENKPVLVIMGRAYNLYDESLNLNLIKDTSKYGFTLLPCDLIPTSRNEVTTENRNMYWSYGQKFIAIAEKLSQFPNFYPIFITNFNCGPDSFLLSLLEDIWSHKPFLILELDEHSGNAGYLTRIEAFLDRIENYERESLQQDPTNYKRTIEHLPDKNKKILFPPMHPVGTNLLTASFRGHGYNAVPLTKEDQSTFQKGKSYLRGSECLPAATTLGSFLDYYDNCIDDDDRETSLFMPCASGPCRFGQYSTIHQMVLNRLQINTSLLSFNSENNYREISGSLRLLIMKSIIITDIIIKLGCRVRPYVAEPQKVDHILKVYTEILGQSLERRNSLKKVLRLLGNDLKGIKPNLTDSKPLVGIVGEIYVRSSPFSND
ncbi:MAG: hypothetical protein K0B81_08875, partial [Candidatus Cloacimonetes bacterium]|nr:hypothetical protein [Candidatus Cloacimonadota bacterium]